MLVTKSKWNHLVSSQIEALGEVITTKKSGVAHFDEKVPRGGKRNFEAPPRAATE